MNDYSQLGIAGLTLGILFFIVRWFVATISKKDKQILDITKDFTIVIENHIVHETEQAKKQTAALRGLTNAIGTLVKDIKK